MIYFGAPDGFLVALDAQTGKLRWETKVDNGQITCKTGEKSVGAAIPYFAERRPIPQFYQVHLGERHF
jgi:glucose dehydrogenase